MAIILMLAGFTFGVVTVVAKKNKLTRARAQIETIVEALEQYKKDYGYYPQQASAAQLTVGQVHGWTKPGKTDRYLSLYSGSGSNKADHPTFPGARNWSDSDPVLDAYGNGIFYQCPGTVNTDKFDLWSRGEDGKHGDNGSSPSDAQTRNDNDDITSWKQK